MRNYIIGILIAATFVAICTPRAAAAVPPQGVYESCRPRATPEALQICTEKLRHIRSGRFTIVLNYTALQGSPENVRTYADEAHRLGIKLIWPLHHKYNWTGTDAQVGAYYAEMSAACGCTASATLVPFMVNILRDLPATFQYYVGDEVIAEERDAHLTHANRVRATDPTHDRMFVAYGNGELLKPFLDSAEVVGADNYTLKGDGGGSPDDQAAVSSTTWNIAQSAGKRQLAVLQAFSWGPDYWAGQPVRYPTQDEYTRMRDVTLANGNPDFILWWAYYRLGDDGQFDRRWADLIAGAFAPEPVNNPSPASPAPAPESGIPGVVAENKPNAKLRPTIKKFSVRWTRKRVRVSFSLSRQTKTRITLRCGRKTSQKRLTGYQTVRNVTFRRTRGACKVTIRPDNGVAKSRNRKIA